MQHRRLLGVLLVLSTLGRVAMDLYLPSFPSIQESLHTTASLVQLTFTIYVFAFFLAQLVYGPASDRFGRRPVVLTGMGIGIIGTIVGWLAPNIEILLLARLIQGLGLGISPLFRPMLRDLFQAEQMARIGVLITGSAAVTLAIAPAIGGYIQYFLDWRAAFLILTIYFVLALLFIWLALPETNQHLDRWALHPKLILSKYWFLAKTPRFLGYAFCSSLTLAGFGAYLTASPYLLQVTIGVSPITYGWLSWILAVGLALGGGINALLVYHIGLYRIMQLAGSTMLAASASIALLGLAQTTLWTLMPCIGIYLLGAGMLFPCATAAALSPFPRIAGAAGALYSALQMAGGFVASLIVSFLSEVSQTPIGILLMVTSLLVLVASAWAHRAEQAHAD